MNIWRMINGLMAAIITVGISFAPVAANASCRIFQHRDYGGSGYTLYNLDKMIMVKGENLGCISSNGASCGRTIFEASWNDQISSFKVTDGCTLTLWQHINEGGSRFRSSRSYLYVGDGWNDQASEAVCTCPNN